eukprot:169553_1
MQSGKSLPAPLAVVDSPNDPLASPEEMDSPNNPVAPKPGRPNRRNVSRVAFISEKDDLLQNVAAVEQNPKCKSDHVMAVLLNEPVHAYIEKKNRKGDVVFDECRVEDINHGRYFPCSRCRYDLCERCGNSKAKEQKSGVKVPRHPYRFDHNSRQKT